MSAATEQVIVVNEVNPSCPQFDIITSRQQVNLFLAGQASGKCLGIDTPIRMYDGSVKPVQDIKAGDLLLGPDGKPRRVLGSNSGQEQMYWIRQKDADDYRVNESHNLVLRHRVTGKIEEISVKNYLQKNIKYKENMLGFRVDFSTKGIIGIRSTKIKVELDIEDNYYGFMVDGDGQFLLGDFTVTHNSFIAGIVSGILISTFPKVEGFIGANTHKQISDTTLKRVRTVWKQYFGWSEWSKDNPNGNYVVGVQPPAHFNTDGHEFTTYGGKISFSWGTVIYFGSLANYKAHDGKEFAWAILDETKDTKEEAVKEVITGRLRQSGMYVNSNGDLCDTANNEKTGEHHTPWNPLYIFTSPAKVDWINEWFNLDEYDKEIVSEIYSDETYFVKDIGNKRVVVCSTFHNQHNLPENYISNQMQNLHSGLQDMLIYGNPFGKAGGEFYKQFTRERQVIDVTKVPGFSRPGAKPDERPYNPDLALHLTFDFNTVPYMTANVWQIVQEFKDGRQTKTAYQIDELCLENPDNTTEAVCREFAKRYYNHTAGLFVYGDASGKHADTRSEKGTNDFIIIVKALAKFRPTMRVPTGNPNVKARGNWINTIFEKGHEGITVFIHKKCQKTIADYTYLKEDSDGSKKKETVKDANTNITYEKYGHCFVGETMITTDKGQKRIDQIEPGDRVLTRYGYRRVLKRWDNGERVVREYNVGDRALTCTPDHKIWTEKHGFKEIGKLPNIGTVVCTVDDGEIKTKDEIIWGIIPRKRKALVYDLMVEEHHEYFANGVLVSNCTDANEYFLCMAFLSEYSKHKSGGGVSTSTKGGKATASRNSY